MPETVSSTVEHIRTELQKVIVGQDEAIEHILIALLAEGHALIEGVPGTAKTLTVKTLSRIINASFSRIQFTPDLMPSDITGTNVFNIANSTFTLRCGPIFTDILLADEINRTPPKTQAALLEAMQERSVTVRGTTHSLQPPFFVLATQNPIELEGTYPLPEAQLDRFVFNVLLDYLSLEDELEVVERNTSHTPLAEVEACTSAAEIMQFQQLVRQVPISREVQQAGVALVRSTRPAESNAPEGVRKYVRYGASVRATQFLLLAAKARALTQDRYHVTLDDLRVLALPVLRHRVLTNYQAESDGVSVDAILREVTQA
jgi:MoxR-like ATPase